MCGKTYTIIDRREQPHPPVGLDVRRDAAGERDAAAIRSVEPRRRQARRRPVRRFAAPCTRIARSDTPIALSQGRHHRVPGHLRADATVRHAEERQQRIRFVGNRRGVVGERHHLAFVFELAHVQQVGHVLEEDAERVPRRRRGEPPQTAVGERGDGGRQAVADAVDRQDRARGETARPRRGGGMTRVVIVERQRRASQPERTQARAEAPAGSGGARRRVVAHSVIQYFARFCQRDSGRAEPFAAGSGSSVPWDRKPASERLRRVAGRHGDSVDIGRRQSARGRGSSEWRVTGKRISSFRRVSRSSLIAATRRPSIDQRRARVMPVPDAQNNHRASTFYSSRRCASKRPDDMLRAAKFRLITRRCRSSCCPRRPTRAIGIAIAG